jgi:hypothetical protein
MNGRVEAVDDPEWDWDEETDDNGEGDNTVAAAGCVDNIT